jgi:hypothetical protein
MGRLPRLFSDAETCYPPIMKSKWIIGFLAGVLSFGVAAAAPAKAPLEVAKGQALALHQSLIAEAKPPVRAKIAASARAAQGFVARSPGHCDLQKFLVRDLRTRFPLVTGQQLDVLLTLAFAETMSDMSQLDQLKLQDQLQKLSQTVQLISDISKNQNDTLKAIIGNLR